MSRPGTRDRDRMRRERLFIEALADALRQTGSTREQIDAVADALVDLNPHFDRQSFVIAAGNPSAR